MLRSCSCDLLPISVLQLQLQFQFQFASIKYQTLSANSKADRSSRRSWNRRRSSKKFFISSDNSQLRRILYKQWMGYGGIVINVEFKVCLLRNDRIFRFEDILWYFLRLNLSFLIIFLCFWKLKSLFPSYMSCLFNSSYFSTWYDKQLNSWLSQLSLVQNIIFFYPKIFLN